MNKLSKKRRTFIGVSRIVSFERDRCMDTTGLNCAVDTMTRNPSHTHAHARAQTKPRIAREQQQALRLFVESRAGTERCEDVISRRINTISTERKSLGVFRAILLFTQSVTHLATQRQ